MPDDARRRHEMETARLLGACFAATRVELPVVGDYQKRPQVVQGLAFMERLSENKAFIR